MVSSKAFATTVPSSVLTAPRISPNRLPARGIPFFVDAATGEDSDFDVPNLKAQDRVGSPVIGCFGNKGVGKTTTAIMFGMRMGERQIAGRQLRVATDDQRTNNGLPEYHTYARARDCVPIEFARFRLNMLDMKLGFNYSEQLHVVTRSFQEARDERLEIYQTDALRYGLKKVRSLFPVEAELGLLSLCLRTLTTEEVIRYRSAIIAELAGRHAENEHFKRLQQALQTQQANEEIKEAKAEASEHAQLTANDESIKAVLVAAQQVASIIDDLLDGPYGEVFGGEHSIAELLKQQVVDADYNGLTTEATVLIQGLLWEIKSAAILRKDHELYTDVEIHDENPELWKYLAYGEPMARFIKRIRATDTTLWMATHRWADYRTVGHADSRQYQLATNMLNDIDITLIGKVGKSTAEEAQDRFKFSNKNRQLLLGAPRGTWMLIIGQETPMWVRTRPTAIELALNPSNEANRANAINDDDSY